MNRRAFLVSLPFLPSAVKAVVAAPVAPPTLAYKANAMGVHSMLRDCGSVVSKPLDLDDIFQQLYALKRNRSDPPQVLYFRRDDGSLIQL